MKVRLPKGVGGGPQNMDAMMRQVQKFQEEREALAADLESREYDVAAGGGAVNLKIDGSLRVTEIKIEPEIIDPDDIGKNKYGMTLIYQNYWMLSAGQDFVLSDINGLKNNITNSKVLDAWNFAWKMIHEYKVIPKAFSNQQSMFFSGQIAMLGGGSYFMQSESTHNYVPQNTKDPWSVVPFPSPKGQAAVAACEGTVWGFPTKVKGNQLQAAMWFLRYYLDDSTYSARDFYPDDQLGTHCWEVMGWMWNQKIQSFNSVGVVTYGGKHSAATIQYSLIDEAATKAAVKTNLDKWYAEIDANITAIVNEL